MGNRSLNNKEMIDSESNFEEAYKANIKSIYRFMFWRTNNAQLAEDLTSQTFEKAWKSRDSFKSGSISAWFHRIARNVLIDHWRKKKDSYLSETAEEIVSDNLSLEQLLEKELELDKLKRALDQLPLTPKKVIVLRFIKRWPSKQVAKEMGLSENNIRIIQYRALKKLRDLMK